MLQVTKQSQALQILLEMMEDQPTTKKMKLLVFFFFVCVCVT